MTKAHRGATSDGIVEAVLPRALFKVRLDEGLMVTASLSKEAQHKVVHLVPGDRVIVKRSPYDPTRGRIIDA